MSTASPKLHVLPSPEALYKESAARVLSLGQQAIAERGSFHMALAGGSTPRALYKLLARNAAQLDWSRVQLYFGDERCVPPDHPDSNYRMVREALLDRLYTQPVVHRMAGEKAPAEAAADYTEILRRNLPADGLDLALLGLGGDGHIASLFPGSATLDDRKHSVLADFIISMNSWRLTLTLPVFDQARQLMLLVSGASKAHVIEQVFNGHASSRLPVQRLHPRGALEWFIDDAAAALIPQPE